jgi:hypothetical protein
MQIEVDFEVFKALTIRRIDEADSENDVLRRLLGLETPPVANSEIDLLRAWSTPPVTNAYATKSPPPSSEDWVAKGVRFPAGTEFRADYKGRTYTARVEGGGLVVNGEKYNSPSAAAISITGNPVNGWKFWECRYEGQPWLVLHNLRKGSR